MEIKEILRRRSDLSTFLVHFTRGNAPRKSLKNILRSGIIEARNPFGMAEKKLSSKGLSTESQKVVCFSETPIEFASLLLEEVSNREVHLKPYGVAITKVQGRLAGLNPVWYMDMSPGSNRDWLTKDVDRLVKDEVKRLQEEYEVEDLAEAIAESPVMRLAPFFEQMGGGRRSDGNGYKKEFWWEREWRHSGNFHLPQNAIVFAPNDFHNELQDLIDELCDPDEGIYDKLCLLDPRWSLEQMIGHLAGFGEKAIGPFPK